MGAIVKLWHAIGACIIAGIFFVGCNANQSATKRHTPGKKNKSTHIHMDGSYLMPDDTRMFKHKDVFLNFNSKGGKKKRQIQSGGLP